YGLVKFRPWARSGFIVLTVVAFLTMPVWGMAVTRPFEGMLANLLVMADGAIIVMLYLTGLAGEFRTSA
ncbi:MAG: hypothetical protein N0E54_18835, partial [Candidatus Thiodiazotropha taylori]|nr:hypothetical protein [Candidatus Thiodiazotropha endolucinida]MCW4230805.1 hypothetical protein [Candidatus Thiodiazotropha taylori]